MSETAYLRTWAEISLAQLARNWRAIRHAVGSGITVAPVVKANAYRHGAVEVARLLEAEGARWLEVSCSNEGIELREAGIRCRILVMGGVLPFERGAVFTANLTPVVHSLQELRDIDLAGERSAVHLKIDTGMSRLGARASVPDVVNAVRDLRHVRVEGLMSHFASAERFDSSQTEEQIALFEEYRGALEHFGLAPELIHFCSSNPIAFGRREAWHNFVRPGLALYGYLSPGSPGAPPPSLPVAPVLTWRARLVMVKDIPEGASVGYGGRFRAPGPMRIGVVAAGYADGVPHRLSGRGHVIAGGRRAAILGAVSMDLTTIDLTAAPHLRAGDPVTLIGGEGEEFLGAQEIAEQAGEIAYSVLCGIGNRVRRVYV